MELLLVGALALGLGFVAGLSIGARRAYSLILGGRAMRTAGARVARFMPPDMPTRSSADILAGRVVILLGGSTYELPVLSRAANRRWLQSLEARFASLAADLGEAADDTPLIMARLVAETDALYELLLSYDTTGVLPPSDEIEEQATDAQVLHAVLEVWRAAHPLAGTLALQTAGTSGSLSEPLSS